MNKQQIIELYYPLQQYIIGGKGQSITLRIPVTNAIIEPEVAQQFFSEVKVSTVSVLGNAYYLINATFKPEIWNILNEK